MSNLSDFDAPKKPWLTAFIPVIVILLAAGAYWIFSIYDSANGSGPKAEQMKNPATDLLQVKTTISICQK